MGSKGRYQAIYKKGNTGQTREEKVVAQDGGEGGAGKERILWN